MKRTLLSLILIFGSVALPGCSVGPDYKRPEALIPASFKEAEGWKIAEPKDTQSRGEWWQIFCDSGLNDLESQLVINNQNLKAAEARFRQAHTLVTQARADFFPSATATGTDTRAKSSTTGHINDSYNASLGLSWEVDVWGKIRRTVEANQASAAASQADLDAATLSAQAELAIDYFSLRIADEQKRLLDETVAAYAKSLSLTEALYKDGMQTRADYLQAKVQLESAQAQALDVGIARAASEHAIAVLIGKSPADFTLPEVLTVPLSPSVPVTLPSTALERRPDIAAAERRAASANAEIGVAEAAFFPDFTLSSAVGFASGEFARWFSPAARVWSIGPSISQPLFDAGLRQSKKAQAIAAYDETVAAYRQTVLGAFQEVEDQLAALRILEQEREVRIAALEDAKASTQVIYNQYKEGIVSYLNVVNAQTIELNNALSALTVKKQRLTTSVSLIKALGGRWETAPSGSVTKADFGESTTTPTPTPPSMAKDALTLTPPKAGTGQ